MSATTFGKYELVSKLASGGMAVTYKAHMFGAKGVKKPVVLKLIHPHLAEEAEFVEMFIEEAKLSATLTHSNIAQVFDFGEIEGRYFIAMELVDGQSLAHVMKRSKKKGHEKLPVPVALLIAIEMCEALYYAHTRLDEAGQPMGLVHRDVSPENVLISWQGEVKVVDFGIAKSTMSAKQTATGMVKGKYPYFSPEQSRADRTMDARTDIYATTVVLYEMLCARRPYEGEFVEVMRSLLTGDYPLPTSLNPEIPPEVEQLIFKGLALDRNARFKTSREMGQALNTVLHTLYPEVQPSDLQSLLSLLFEDDLKAAGRPVEIRSGFKELFEGRPALATDEVASDKTPPLGTPAIVHPGAGLATGKRKAAMGAKTVTPGSGRVPASNVPTAVRPSGAKRSPSGQQKATQVPDTRVQPGGPDMTAEEEPITDGEPAPTKLKTTGSQVEQVSLDSPEKAEARSRAVKLMAIAAGVVFVLIAVVAIGFSLSKPKEIIVAGTPVWATSLPPGAQVSVDGKPQGPAPMDGQLFEGTYTFGMTLEGYRPWTKRMRIAGTRQIHIEGKLEPLDGGVTAENAPGIKVDPQVPDTQVPDGGTVTLEQDKAHEKRWPTRSFTLWPKDHTLAIGQYKTFSVDLEPGTTYFISPSGSIDLGKKLGKTSVLMYYLEGEKIDPRERFGFLPANGKKFSNVTKLYAWVFDDDLDDNRGKIQLTLRISQYIPERFATFDATEHAVMPAASDVFKLDGLLADHTYRLVFRPDDPRVMGASPPQGVFCLLETPKAKPIQKRYVFYSLKFNGDLTGVTALQCMFLAWENSGTSGIVEVDIDDLAELELRNKK